MATYQELFDLYNNSVLRNRINVACVIAAQAIAVELVTVPNHANRLLWAKQVFGNPEGVATSMLMAALAVNAGLTVAQITGATDAALQTVVNKRLTSSRRDEVIHDG